MRVSKEKVPEKRVRPSASVLILMAVAAAILSPMLLLPVSAQEGEGTPRPEDERGAPPDADCWGEVTSEFAHRLGGIGGHASAQEEPRDGVGNQEEGHPSQHGATVGAIVNIPCEEDRNDN
jgi:hypothetical protein